MKVTNRCVQILPGETREIRADEPKCKQMKIIIKIVVEINDNRKQWQNWMKTKFHPFRKLMKFSVQIYMKREEKDTNYKYQQWVVSLIVASKIQPS